MDPKTGPSGLSPLEAIGLYRVWRLAARIKELRDIGHPIVTVMKGDRTNKRYARYFMKGFLCSASS